MVEKFEFLLSAPNCSTLIDPINLLSHSGMTAKLSWAKMLSEREGKKESQKPHDMNEWIDLNISHLINSIYMFPMSCYLSYMYK